MNKYTLPLLACLFALLASCQDTPEAHVPAQEIHITDFNGKTLEQAQQPPLMRRIELYEDANGYIGQIKDLCAIDSSLYLFCKTGNCNTPSTAKEEDRWNTSYLQL